MSHPHKLIRARKETSPMQIGSRRLAPAATVLLAVLLSGAASTGGEQPGAAERLLAAGQYDAAATSLRTVLAAHPDDADTWFRLGTALEHLGHDAAASAAYGHAADSGMTGLRPLVRAAVTAAHSGDADRAFAWLTRAVEGGLSDRFLDQSDQLTTLRSDARFAPLLARAEHLTHPCRYQPQYRQLDFWLGDWEVYRGDAVVGHNTITKEEDGCVVAERWRSLRGGTGRSVSYFDPGSGDWRQLWVDARGGVITGRGGLAHGSMHLLGERLTAAGARTDFRMTLTPNDDGSVRQLLEESSDGGTTWRVWFDGRYVHPAPAP